jgi:hypothetical protein
LPNVDGSEDDANVAAARVDDEQVVGLVDDHRLARDGLYERDVGMAPTDLACRDVGLLVDLRDDGRRDGECRHGDVDRHDDPGRV